jgi:uncharacterized protein YebE (UPF0316 family)
MELLLNCLIIFIVRIVDVSLGTLSTVLVIRGKKGLGSIIGFTVIVILFLIVREALSAENSSLWIAMAYAGGYAAGTYVGSWLEEKLAIGNSSIMVITKGLRYDVVELIRKRGFGVSSVVSQGIDKENLMLFIEVGRKHIKDVMETIKQIAPDSFIAISDTRQIINGYFGR